MTFLVVHELTKNFGGLAALSQVSLQIEQKEIVGLIGPNGAGKTTLFNVITGVFKPSAGKVVYKGQDITGQKPCYTARQGLVRTFQQTLLFRESTAIDNVQTAFYSQLKTGFLGFLFNLPHARSETAEVKKKAEQILDRVGLLKVKDEMAKNLPLGHQKVLGIAIALAARPKMLLLDEPVMGMNIEETKVMMNLIKGLRNYEGLTMIIVEHDMQAVMGLSDKIVVLNHGVKIAEGSPDEIRANKNVVDAYLGTRRAG